MRLEETGLLLQLIGIHQCSYNAEEESQQHVQKADHQTLHFKSSSAKLDEQCLVSFKPIALRDERSVLFRKKAHKN